jgi:hypothetical protein
VVFQSFEVISAVKWYFESKNLSLRNAFALRCPLSVENQTDLRQYYSQYFVSLLSATELLLDDGYKNRRVFEETLYRRLVFEGFLDGKSNYCYLRELRNSIIHRGLDICSAAHVNNAFPFLIAPAAVMNRKKTDSYTAFGYYLVDIIRDCESIIGKIFLDHFEKSGLFLARISKEEFIRINTQHILDSIAMPEWVKTMSLRTLEQINYDELQESSIKSLSEVLRLNAFDRYFIPPSV